MQIFVIGMHRSGTSLTARLLNLMGAYFCSEGMEMPANPGNPKGYWERLDVFRLNKNFILELGHDWYKINQWDLNKAEAESRQNFQDQARKIILAMDAHRPWMLKDPRFCLLFPLWRPFLEFPICVHVYRSPLQVAQSLRSRNEFPLQFGVALWEKYALESLKVTKDCPKLLVQHSQLINNPLQTVTKLYEELSNLGCQGLRIPNEKEINAFVSSELYRERGSTEFEAGFINKQQSVLVNAFESGEVFELAEKTNLELSPSAQETLEFYENHWALKGEHQKITNVLEKTQTSEAMLKQEREQLKTSVQSLETAVRTKEASEAALKQEREQLKTSVQSLQQEREKFKATVQSLQQEREKFKTNVQFLQQERENLREKRESLTKALAITRDQVSVLNSKKQHLENQLQKVHRQHSDHSTQMNVAMSKFREREWQLNRWIQSLGQDTKALLSSWRWRLGCSLIRPIEWILLRTRVRLSSDHMQSTFAAYQTWTIKKEAEDALLKSHRLEFNNDKKKADFLATPIEQESIYETLIKDFEKKSPLFSPVIQSPYQSQDHQLIEALNWKRKRLAEQYLHQGQHRKVSVIMPTYNREKIIKRAISSVIAQTYKNWELIVIDDAGKDKTYDVIKKIADERIHYIYSESNGGAAGARNVGIKKSKGDYIAYLDSDNEWDPNFILIMVHQMEENHADIAYCAQRLLDDTTGKERGIRYSSFNRAFLENRNYIDLNTLVHSRELINRYGAFRSDMRRLVDWDLLLRLTLEKTPITIPCILSDYYEGRSDQVTNQENLRKALAQLDHALKSKPIQLDGLKAIKQEGALFAINIPKQPVKFRRKVSIIIPSYQVLPYLRVCVESIVKYTPENWFNLIIVDNNSDQDVQKYLQSIGKTGKIITCFNEKNMGFSYAVNRGIELSEPDSDIILLNNDAVVTPDWLEALWRVKDDFEDVGLIVPRQTLLPHTKTMNVHVPFCRPERELDVNVSIHHDNIIEYIRTPIKGYIELSFAPFFAAYIPREVIELIGPLDHENGPHYRSDRLYCEKVRSLGKKIIYTPYSKLYHFLQQATGKLRQKDQRLYEKMFVKNDWEEIQKH